MDGQEPDRWAAESWRDDFVLRRSSHGDDAAVRSRIDAGDLVRVIRSVYLPRPIAESRSRRAAHRDLAYAHELRRPMALTFSHATAASLWRLPRIGGWPIDAHVTSREAAGGRSSDHLIRHVVDLHQTEAIDGISVTGLARTIVDLARTETFLNGVVAADAALRGLRFFGEPLVSVAREALTAELPPRGHRGRAKACAVIAFADGRSASPGESLSRVRIEELGMPRPELQPRISDEFGDMFPDFCWPAHRVLGEFDGLGKYLRHEFMNGRSVAEVIIDEKWREDRLRNLGWRVIRWGWHEAVNPQSLRPLLFSAGLRPA
jgi:hypothetical protein